MREVIKELNELNNRKS